MSDDSDDDMEAVLRVSDARGVIRAAARLLSVPERILAVFSRHAQGMAEDEEISKVCFRAVHRSRAAFTRAFSTTETTIAVDNRSPTPFAPDTAPT